MSVRNLALHGPPPERILIVMLSALGDAVHVLPVLEALKRTWRDCHITWLIQPIPHRLVAGVPSVDQFLIFRRRRGLSAWQSFQELALQYPTRPYDLLFALQVYLKAGILTALAPAEHKLGFDRALSNIRGAEGTTIRLGLVRESGATAEVVVTSQKISAAP